MDVGELIVAIVIFDWFFTGLDGLVVIVLLGGSGGSCSSITLADARLVELSLEISSSWNTSWVRGKVGSGWDHLGLSVEELDVVER